MTDPRGPLCIQQRKTVTFSAFSESMRRSTPVHWLCATEYEPWESSFWPRPTLSGDILMPSFGPWARIGRANGTPPCARPYALMDSVTYKGMVVMLAVPANLKASEGSFVRPQRLNLRNLSFFSLVHLLAFFPRDVSAHYLTSYQIGQWPCDPSS